MTLDDYLMALEWDGVPINPDAQVTEMPSTSGAETPSDLRPACSGPNAAGQVDEAEVASPSRNSTEHDRGHARVVPSESSMFAVPESVPAAPYVWSCECSEIGT